MKKIVETVDIIIRRVVLYLRLSKEDIDKPTKEAISESIKNQELMLREEVAKHPDWEIVGVYCDEDFSGAGTYRPDFEKMIKSCENGEVDIVLCKSQSRFSRDMEVVEKYLHNKFIVWGVRFVSIVDNADTANKGNKKARQINALVNEWFLEDLSDNIKATFRTKWKNGECTSSFAKYGLMKDPKNKNHLLIDPIASEVLKQIAEMFLSGYGQDKIANTLEEKKIPSPYEYKAMNGCKLKLPISKKEDKYSISKAGQYIVRISLYNEYKQILRNIKSIYVFGTDELKEYNSKFHIRVRSISEDLKLYYTTDNLSSNIDNINFNNIDFSTGVWHELKTNDTIPDDVFYIGSTNIELDRLIETGFELEIKLDDNKCHNTYKMFTKSVAADTDTEFKFEYEIRKKYKWSGRVIYEMLRDPIYNGTLIQGKTRRISYKNHKCINAKKEHWVTSESALEKIFDDEKWLSIQTKLNEVSRSGADGVKHIFCGKVYCSECGSILRKNSSCQNKDSEKVEYLLCKDKENKWANCDNNRSIKLNVLEDYVLSAMNGLLDEYYDKDTLKELHKEVINKDLFKDQLDSFNKEKTDIQNLIKRKKEIFQQLYEDRATGVIDDNDFTSLRAKYKEDVDKLSERLSTIDNELKLIEMKQNKLKDRDSLLSKYRHIELLTPEILDEFVDKIKVGKIDDETKTREIRIVWNFQT